MTQSLPTLKPSTLKTPSQSREMIAPWAKSEAMKCLEAQLLQSSSVARRMTIQEIFESDAKDQCYIWEKFSNNVQSLLKKHNITLPKKPCTGNNTAKKMDDWKSSLAMRFLWKWLMENDSSINNMSNKEIYNTKAMFQKYNFKAFEEYLKKLYKGMQGTQMQRIDYQWISLLGYAHPASKLLEEDVKSGLAFDLKPASLRQMREEYKTFPAKVFRKHVEQEKRAQREYGYWVYQRNKEGREKRIKEKEELKKEGEEHILFFETRVECEEMARALIGDNG
eukprot:CCRYP_011347-RA/>CCRYP_011347-RA protein AED:0.20 eAED:-0.08 QI:0/0/0/1/0/0/2/0/278